MSDLSFTWRGASSDSYGLVVRSLPAPISGAQRNSTVIVPGRHGALHLMDGARDEILLNIECYLPYEQGVAVSDLRAIVGWLTGGGQLTLSDQPGVFFYGQILEAVNYEPVLPGFRDRIFSLPIWVKPHAYKLEVSDIAVAVSGTEVVNPCTAESEPVISVTGSGDITLNVGGYEVELDMVDGQITLDCEARLAHKDGVLAGSRVALSEWPVLVPGSNVISWTGAVTMITISPRWRWV
jgi:phage-related protein